MSARARIWILKMFGLVLTLVFVAPVSIGWSAPGLVKYAGEVMAVDRTTGKIVVGDMGPLLGSGTSAITPRSVEVTASTEFAAVKRCECVAPSGWVGDFVENPLQAWEVKPGDYVAVQVRRDTRVAQALKITVIDPDERLTLDNFLRF